MDALHVLAFASPEALRKARAKGPEQFHHYAARLVVLADRHGVELPALVREAAEKCEAPQDELERMVDRRGVDFEAQAERARRGKHKRKRPAGERADGQEGEPRRSEPRASR